MSEPSISEANKVLRVLAGQRLKYTARLNRPAGKESFEFQTDLPPKVIWSEQRRSLVWVGQLPTESYETRQWEIMPVEPDDIMLVELNPTV